MGERLQDGLHRGGGGRVTVAGRQDDARDTHPIVSPENFKENPPDYMFVTAWNYADHIRAKEHWFQGIWSVPLPDLRFF